MEIGKGEKNDEKSRSKVSCKEDIENTMQRRMMRGYIEDRQDKESKQTEKE